MKFVDARKASRLPGGGLAVFYWTGGRSGAHPLREISLSGAVIETPDRYSRGTLIKLVLGFVPGADRSSGPAEPLSLWARVVRQEAGALCVKFAFSNRNERDALRRLLEPPAGASTGSQKEMPAPQRAGQALLEFAVVFPLIFLLIVNVVNFGGLIYAWITVSNAARTGAQYLIMGGATVGGPSPPTGVAVQAAVTADLATLPNRANAQIRVCLRNGATVTCTGPGTSVPPVDVVESGVTYAVGSVDVSYPYTPFIPLPSAGLFGFRTTVPPVTVHRQAAMRVLQ
jgi:Flp pilus assembly protein TadG